MLKVKLVYPRYFPIPHKHNEVDKEKTKDYPHHVKEYAKKYPHALSYNEPIDKSINEELDVIQKMYQNFKLIDIKFVHQTVLNEQFDETFTAALIIYDTGV